MKISALRVSAILLCSLLGFQSAAQTSKTYEFTNGKWFDGKRFKRKKFYSANGVLTEKRPPNIDEPSALI